MLDSEDVQQQNREWVTCKRLKGDAQVPVLNQDRKEKDCACSGEDDGHQLMALEKVTASASNAPDGNNITRPERKCLSAQVEVITFILGASSIQDPSLPLPGPSRFSRAKK
jgi:hypothetical protein